MITSSVGLEKLLAASLVWVYTLHKILTWSTGFMATPRVFGHEFRLTANLCLARDASGRIISTQVLTGTKHVSRTQKRLVCSSASSNYPNHAPCTALDNLLRAAR